MWSINSKEEDGSNVVVILVVKMMENPALAWGMEIIIARYYYPRAPEGGGLFFK